MVNGMVIDQQGMLPPLTTIKLGRTTWVGSTKDPTKHSIFLEITRISSDQTQNPQNRQYHDDIGISLPMILNVLEIPKCTNRGATTLSITTLSIMGLLATLSTNNTQHNNTAILLSIFMMCVLFNLLLCCFSLC